MILSILSLFLSVAAFAGDSTRTLATSSLIQWKAVSSALPVMISITFPSIRTLSTFSSPLQSWLLISSEWIESWS